jgi:hypothetical protein
MDPLERAHNVLARAAAASSLASQVLPVRARLTAQVHAASSRLATARAAHSAAASASLAARRAQVESEAATALARARCIQLMRLSHELLGAVGGGAEEEGEGLPLPPGLAAEQPPVPVDDPALPYGVREPIRLQARQLAGGGTATPFLPSRTSSRTAAAAAAAASAVTPSLSSALSLTRPDILQAAAAAADRDELVLGVGHEQLRQALEAWVAAELARQERLGTRGGSQAKE